MSETNHYPDALKIVLLGLLKPQKTILSFISKTYNTALFNKEGLHKKKKKTCHN